MASTLFKSRLSWCLDEGDLSHRWATESCFGYEKRQRKVKRLSSALYVYVSMPMISIMRLTICLSLADIVCLFLSCYISRCASVPPFLYRTLPVFLTVYLYAYLSLCLSDSICLSVCLLLPTFLCLYLCLSLAPSISHSFQSVKTLLQTWTLVRTFRILGRPPQRPPFNGWYSWVQKQSSREVASEAKRGRLPSRNTKASWLISGRTLSRKISERDRLRNRNEQRNRNRSMYPLTLITPLYTNAPTCSSAAINSTTSTITTTAATKLWSVSRISDYFWQAAVVIGSSMKIVR